MSSNDSKNDVIESALKGVTKGLLEWSSEKISGFIKKFKEKKLAFIKEQKTIDIVREQYSSGEGKFYQKYITDKDLLFLIRMGLTLRKLEDDEARMMNLRNKIFNKFKTQGLHVAEFVKSRLLNRYVGMLIDELESLDNLGKEIEKILKEIDKHVLFVQSFDEAKNIIMSTLTKINSFSPDIFVIAGTKSAGKIVEACEKKLISTLKNYELEVISEKGNYNLFFKRVITKQ